MRKTLVATQLRVVSPMYLKMKLFNNVHWGLVIGPSSDHSLGEKRPDNETTWLHADSAR